MLKKIILALSLAAIPILAAAGCSNSVSPGQEFTLPVGRSVTVTGEDLAIKFIGINGSDSRTPKGVQTIWAGEARIQLEVTRGGSKSNVTVVEIGNTQGYTRTIFDKYVFNTQLQPYPEADKLPAPGDYKLLMTITADTGTEPPPGPSGVPIVDNGAIVIGEVKSVTSLNSSHAWAVEILVQSVGNFNNMPNLVAGKEGQTITVQTDQDAGGLKAGQVITATVKLSGDEHGTFFYSSNITK